MKEINPNLNSSTVQKFIESNLHLDVAEIALKYKEIPGVTLKEILSQIQGRQKAKTKLPSWFLDPLVIYPISLSLEQSSSETTAHYKSKLVSGSSLADLTGGLGVDAIAFSNMFNHVYYIEQNEDLCAVAKYNSSVFGINNISIHHTSAEEFLLHDQKFDCIYLDPARRDRSNNKIFRLEDCDPDVLDLLPNFFERTNQLLIKTSPLQDIKGALIKFKGHVTQVHVVAVMNECKEVLYLLSHDVRENPDIFAVNIRGSNKQELLFTFKEEELVNPAFSMPQKYLYEPNAAILKAGAFNVVASKYNVKKLHKNTHLYTSDSLVENFPGRKFMIAGVEQYSKKDIQNFIKVDKANISTRNFSDSVEKIRKKLGLKDGGNYYLFATTNLTNKPTVLICTKISEH